MNHEYKFKATIDGKKIHITSECGPSGFASAFAAKIIDTEDKAIRESLKRLGWMSPEDVARVDVGFNQAKHDAYYNPSVPLPPAYVQEASAILSRTRYAQHRVSDPTAAAGISNQGKSRYSNMSLTELLTEAEACVRNGITSPLYDAVLERLRWVAETLGNLNEPR